MRALLTSIGSTGDINPFIALGLELKRRGHDPLLVVNPYFKETVEAAGLAFEPLGEYVSAADFAIDMPAAFGRFWGPLVVFRRLFVPVVPEMVETIRSAAVRHKSEVLIGHHVSLGLPWVAHELGLPWATCVLSPATLISLEDPSRMPVGLDLHRMPMWYRRFAHALQRTTARVMFERPLRKQRRARGLPPCRDIFWGEMLSGDAVIGLWSPLLRPRAGDDPPTLSVCGFPWFDRKAQYGEHGRRLDPAIARFLDDGAPPVVFTLGSVLSHVRAREFAAASEACRILGVRGLLVTGRPDTAPPAASLPPGVMCVDYAPYGELLHRGAVTVHHGGVGTTAQALRAAKPTVIMPFAHDQFDNAARAERLGVSLTLPPGRRSARRLASAVSAVLGSPDMLRRASEVGGSIAREDGVGWAAKVIEGVVSARSGREQPSQDHAVASGQGPALADRSHQPRSPCVST